MLSNNLLARYTRKSASALKPNAAKCADRGKNGNSHPQSNFLGAAHFKILTSVMITTLCSVFMEGKPAFRSSRQLLSTGSLEDSGSVDNPSYKETRKSARSVLLKYLRESHHVEHIEREISANRGPIDRRLQRRLTKAKATQSHWVAKYYKFMECVHHDNIEDDLKNFFARCSMLETGESEELQEVVSKVRIDLDLVGEWLTEDGRPWFIKHGRSRGEIEIWDDDTLHVFGSYDSGRLTISHILSNGQMVAQTGKISNFSDGKLEMYWGETWTKIYEYNSKAQSPPDVLIQHLEIQKSRIEGLWKDRLTGTVNYIRAQDRSPANGWNVLIQQPGKPSEMAGTFMDGELHVDEGIVAERDGMLLWPDGDCWEKQTWSLGEPPRHVASENGTEDALFEDNETSHSARDARYKHEIADNVKTRDIYSEEIDQIQSDAAFALALQMEELEYAKYERDSTKQRLIEQVEHNINQEYSRHYRQHAHKNRYDGWAKTVQEVMQNDDQVYEKKLAESQEMHRMYAKNTGQYNSSEMQAQDLSRQSLARDEDTGRGNETTHDVGYI